jgi:glycosyltransferase involved in cell wall biosynthesis
MPEIAVIIPTFRRPQELSEALLSVVAQEVDLEIVVVDDSPEGGARDIVERLQDGRVRYVKNERPTNGIPSVVRNIGWPMTTAPVLHFLDDDDIVPAGHYRTALTRLRARPDVGSIFGVVEPFGDDANMPAERAFFAAAARRARRCRRLGNCLAFAANQLFGLTMLVCSAGLVRRSVIEAIGGFDPEIHRVEDVDMYARAFRHAGTVFVDDVSLRYRILPTSLMHGRSSEASVLHAYQRMWDKHRLQYGRMDLLGLKLLAKTLLRSGGSD